MSQGHFSLGHDELPPRFELLADTVCGHLIEARGDCLYVRDGEHHPIAPELAEGRSTVVEKCPWDILGLVWGVGYRSGSPMR